MSYLILSNHAELVAIGSMAEGRHEVVANDCGDDCPVAVDLQSVIDWIWQEADTKGRAYPARIPLELSGAEIEELAATIEMVAEQGEDWNDEIGAPFAASVET